jgi:hypothetical protein
MQMVFPSLVKSLLHWALVSGSGATYRRAVRCKSAEVSEERKFSILKVEEQANQETSNSRATNRTL